VETSTFFRRHNPGRRLPRFWWLTVERRPGIDDMGLTVDGMLVVSLRAFEVLMRHTVRHASFYQYPSSSTGVPTAP
jgi:hypothetical protein